MKQHSKKTTTAFVSVALLAGTFAPFMTFAQDPGTATDPGVLVKSFCTRLPEFSGKVSGNLSERQTKIDERTAEVFKNTANNRIEMDTKVKESRAGADVRRNEQILKLTERATTPERQTAVKNFTAVLSTAISTRRTAVDAARATSRVAVDKIENNKKTSVEALLTAFKSSVNTALEKAKTNCTAGVAPKTVRTQLLASLKSSRTTLQTSIKSLDKFSDLIVPIRTARDVAIKKAQDDFAASMEKAKADLKATFPEA